MSSSAIPTSISAPLAAPSSSSANSRYISLNHRLTPILASAAIAITAEMLGAIWGQWRSVGLVVAMITLAVLLNVSVNFWLMARFGRVVELARNVANVLIFVGLNRVTDWPLAGWLWLPYTALAFDHLDPQVATATLIGSCLSLDLVALHDGVSWIYPLTFTLLAVFCSEISRRRFATIRDMLLRSDAQRRELEQAHVSLAKAHAQLTEETEARVRAEADLRQAQKLEAVGRLASGVAHEINTPIQFISDSVHFMREAFGDLGKMIAKYASVTEAVHEAAELEEAIAEVAIAERDLDLRFVLEELPKAIDRSLEGLGRVAAIVRAMKEFAHPDQKEKTDTDLNRAILGVLEMARSEYKYVADVETTLGDLPSVRCHAGELNQALLNIIVNAAHAIGDVVKETGAKGRIAIRSYREGDDVLISIADTGGGIRDVIRERIFDPFFTTKEVGKGTGQGLAIARSVVVDKHGGVLTVDSKVGVGSTFTIRVPVDGGMRDKAVAP